MATWKTTSRVWDSKLKTHVTVKVELDIEWQKIADALAAKAYRNTSRKSKLAIGIEARVSPIKAA